MRDESGFVEAMRANPSDELSRLVYADWLDEQGDRRGEFLRLHLALRSLPPDHPHRTSAEEELSRLRKGIDPGWLAVAEPERAHLVEDPPRSPACTCLEPGSRKRKWSRPIDFHVEPQDTECDAWHRLLDLVEQAAADGRTEFAPRRDLDPDDWMRIVTLPPTIAKLKSVRHLLLYGSHLVRIPPQIGEMTSLEQFEPYTSYRLHWFPYEITRCPNLQNSIVSTRALYGNYKYRPPFPRLKPRKSGDAGRLASALFLKYGWTKAIRNCSVCDSPFEDRGRYRVWISLRVATDVLPLLVNACSEECVHRLPSPAEGYVQEPHRGGREVEQPPSDY
jgi:uncharacterized protein (TIGR02996 family)